MKKLSILLTLVSLFICNSSFASTANSAKSEWVLEQTYNQSEEHRLYLSSDAVKIVFISQGFFVVAKAPDFNAYCYRPDGKKYWVGKLDTFTGDLLINPFAIPKYRRDVLTQEKDVKYNGEFCHAYTSDKEGSLVYGSKSISLPPLACEFVCRYFNIPSMNEVPVFRQIEPTKLPVPITASRKDKVWSTDNQLREQRDRRRVMLATKSMKKIPYNASDFDQPKGFVKTKDAGDIGVTGAQRRQIGVALDELGFSSDYVRTEKEKKDK